MIIINKKIIFTILIEVINTRMLNKFSAFVKDYDLFSRQIGLHMNKNNFYKTSLGGFCSWLVILFIFAFFWSRIASFLNKEEVKVIKNRTFNPDPPYSSLNTERFMFAVNIDQPNQDFLTHPYFNITVKQIVKQKVGNTQVFTRTDIQLEPCTPDHWNSMSQALANFTTLFKSFGTDFLCPVLGQKMQLQGMWGSDVFQYIEVQVEPCVSPNDPNQKWNPVCATQEEVQEQTKKLGFHGINFYHSNYVLNADQPTNYFTPYINDKLYFMFVPNKQAQNCDIYFQDIQVITDQSLLPISDFDDIKFLTQENNDVRETTQLFRIDDKFVTLTLRMSPYVSVINRQYKKASQLLSELGGFIQIVFTCVGILLIKYNNFRFTIDLANNLYQFNSEIKQQQTTQRNKKEKTQQSNNYVCQSLGVSPSKQQNSQFFKDMSSIKNGIDSQGVKVQKDLALSSSIHFISNQNNEVIAQKCQDNLNQNKINKSIPCINNNNTVKSQTQIELISNQSLGKKFSINQNPTSIQNLGNKEKIMVVDIKLDIDRPIDKFKRAVFKIIKKSKIFLDFLKNDKNIFVKQFTQTQQERITKENYLIAQFHKILEKPYRFDVGIQYLLHKLSFGYFYNNDYNHYITKATDMIHSDLDICNILEKLQQIDKIKTIIFNQSQQTIFNFYQKPKINLEKNQNQRSPVQISPTEHKKSSKDLKKNCFKSLFNQKSEEKIIDQGILSPKINYDTVNSYKLLYNSFLKLNSNLSCSFNSSSINKKLIKYLGPELLNIFLQSQSLDSQPKVNQTSEIKRLYEGRSQNISSFQKQQALRQFKQIQAQKNNEISVDLSLINNRKSLSYESSFRNQNTIQMLKQKETPQAAVEQLSESTNSHNYPIIALGEIKNIKTISNITYLNPDETKSPFKKIDISNQQFSFHQYSQELGSEEEIPEVEPQSRNIKKLQLKIDNK
ncbi:transmembrane protein, putative (macronuclear) [Tetrahymena thermophila SB210]|uniref:Transmembrane protein, putative n=1 Tax=Tetrahymena thermophila (strain SB210) TaxID=312017 RepID=Q22W74_TETTS|nr:transmembrane protein, putative [Tetrahymena thermophila SB210]EAR89543.2 transmembrane protein, putative [Tetrahymena thermophila SB210]|eukprot:XP_001009788.2 transmembrane protein, putative [Tetrahymena thermophila SB210]